MHRLGVAFSVAVLLAPCVAIGDTSTYAVAPVECAFGVTPAEAEGYYQAIVQRLTVGGGLRVLERRNLPLILKERDLASTLDADGTDSVYAATGRKMQATRILVPGICHLVCPRGLCPHTG